MQQVLSEKFDELAGEIARDYPSSGCERDSDDQGSHHHHPERERERSPHSSSEGGSPQGHSLSPGDLEDGGGGGLSTGRERNCSTKVRRSVLGLVG
jgi:hypothetical protein